MELRGRTVDDRGTPVAAARVVLDGTTFTTTDVDGTFVFRDVAQALHRLRATKDDLCTDELFVTLFEPRAPIVVIMTEGCTVAFTVTANGAPVEGARISTHGRDDVCFVTDANGRAVVRGVEETFFVFDIEADGYAHAHESMLLFFHLFDVEADGYARALVQVLLSTDPGEVIEQAVSLERGATAKGTPAREDLDQRLLVDTMISGVVVDPRGHPVPGVGVSTNGSVGDRTDEHGRFFLTGLSPGPHELYLVRPHLQSPYDRTSGGTINAGDTHARIVLPDATTVVGRVLFNGADVPHVGVMIASRLHGVHTADGRFTLDDVPRETTSLLFVAPGTGRLLVDVALEPGATVDLGDIELPEGQRIRGVVRDPSGAPVPGARVLIGVGTDRQLSSIDRAFACEYETVSAADGSFRFDGVATKPHGVPVRAIHPRLGHSVTVVVTETDDAKVPLVLGTT